MLLTQPNTRNHIPLKEIHTLPLKPCCPVSGNPQPGSEIVISYTPSSCFLEVYSLRKYIDSYIGGRGDVRDMEGMIQQIAADCTAALGVAVSVTANLIINPAQQMTLTVEVSHV